MNKHWIYAAWFTIGFQLSKLDSAYGYDIGLKAGLASKAWLIAHGLILAQ